MMDTSAGAAGATDGNPRKKLFFKPDLTVVIHYKGVDGKVEEKTYHECAFRLAEWSDFFDAALSNNMKEKDTHTIKLHDATPELWESALGFLKSPLQARSMTHHDAVQVVEFYHEYQFMEGLKLCDTVLAEYIAGQLETAFPSDLDLLVNTIALACRLDMNQSKDCGVEYLEKRLRLKDLPAGPLMFTVEHIEALHFLFKRGHISEEAVPTAIRSKIQSPSFPATLVLHTLKRNAIFTKSHCHGGDWVLVSEHSPTEDRQVLMRCLNSSCLPYPPKDQWDILDPRLGHNSPILRYLNEDFW